MYLNLLIERINKKWKKKIIKILDKIDITLQNNHYITNFGYKYIPENNKIKIIFEINYHMYKLYYKPCEVIYLGFEGIYNYILKLINKED